MLETPWTRLLGLRVPIQLAPLPFHGDPDLAVAVADAGGLGMVGLPLHPPDAVGKTLDLVASRGYVPGTYNSVEDALYQFITRVARGYLTGSFDPH